MRRLVRRYWAVFLLLLTPAMAYAAPKAEAIVIVADTRKFTGLRGWWANLYNESHLYVTIVTVLIVPLLGLLLGKLTTLALSRLGINLKSRQLAEH